MNEKAKKYVTMFRQVKIASAATVDAGGQSLKFTGRLRLADKKWVDDVFDLLHYPINWESFS